MLLAALFMKSQWTTFEIGRSR